MSIGTGPDIPSYDKEREKEVKLGDEVQDWWDSIVDSEQFFILDKHYPDQLADWESLSWEEKLDIFKEQNGYGERVKV